MVADCLHRLHVAADAKVLKVPSKLRAQNSVLLGQIHMPVVPTPDPKRLHRLPDFLAGRLLFNHPVRRNGFSPLMRIVRIKALFSVWREYPQVVGQRSTYPSMRYRAGLSLLNRKRILRSAPIYVFSRREAECDSAASVEVAARVGACVVEVSVEQHALRRCPARRQG